MDALFTAVSVVTLTGLVTQNTATYWTPFGQGVIVVLMFISGMGFMTLSSFLLILLGQRVSLISQRFVMRESVGVDQVSALLRLGYKVLIVVAAIQVLGFVALLIRFSFIYAPVQAMWYALFQAVSSFNSAGFVAIPGSHSVSALQQDAPALAIITTLIVLGAVSWWVLVDIAVLRRWKVLPLNSKLVLSFTAFLILSGALFFLLMEFTNPGTLQELSFVNKTALSVFEATSGRTAGFTTVDYGETEQHTNFFMTGLMLIGGASASVAGGIKINTIAVLTMAVVSTIKGRSYASAFKRKIPHIQVQRAMTLAVSSLLVIFIAALLLTFSERNSGIPFIELLFESVSAFSTVGLSTGITPELSTAGRLVLICTMFLGRVGPLMLVIMMVTRNQGNLYRFARERVTIG